MQRKPSITAASILIALLLFPTFAPALRAQDAPPPSAQDGPPPPPPTPDELDQLLAPIALYPDSLLAQITTASTNPQEILDVDNWLASNPNLTGAALTDAAQQQGFDPAFIALVTFPTVLEMMAEHIDDYAAIGQAVTANQAEVASSIQRLRSQAYASGALRSNLQQQVEVQQASGQPIYAIQPANPQVVYVPEYDPTVVYVRPSTSDIVATSLLSFGVGIGIRALLVNNHPWGWGGWGWNWGGRAVYYNHGPWGGWHGGYRPPNIWYRPRPVVWGNRPGYRGNWGYRPPNYRAPSHINRPGAVRPGNRPGGPSYNRPGGTPGNRPGYTPGNRPGYTPGTRPGSTPGNRPGNVNRPSVQPNTPNNRPGFSGPTRPNNPRPEGRPGGNQPSQNSRPAPQNRPSPQNRPAPQNRPSPPSGGDRSGGARQPR
jgi:hypothetical protein